MSVFSFTKTQAASLKVTEYIPNEPDWVCVEGCNAFMQKVEADFFNMGESVDLTPAVYSGECHHAGRDFNSERTDYSVVMIDQHPKENKFYFSTIFTYFVDENEFANWDLSTSRKEMNSYWLDHGDIQQLANSKTNYNLVTYDDGNPAYTYFMRQNPVTKTLYYITLAGESQIAFCRLEKNKN